MKKFTKKSKKLLFLLLPVLIIVATISIFMAIEGNETSNNGNISDQYTYSTRKVYVVSNDNVVVPLSISFVSKETLGEEILYMVSLLKANSSLNSSSFSCLLPEETSILNISLDDYGVATVNFSKEFSGYEAKDELKILETITWTLTEFKEINQVVLQVESEQLLNMPVSNTPIPEVLNRNIGINNYLITSTSHFVEAERVLSVYSKTIDGDDYLIPVTHYVNNKDNLDIYDLTVNTLFEKPSITTRLKIAKPLENVKVNGEIDYKDNELTVSLNEQALFDETTVDTDVYKVLVIATQLLDVHEVSFIIGEEAKSVNGLVDNDEAVEVSSIIYNSYQI